jgi:hypothetical protein
MSMKLGKLVGTLILSGGLALAVSMQGCSSSTTTPPDSGSAGSDGSVPDGGDASTDSSTDTGATAGSTGTDAAPDTAPDAVLPDASLDVSVDLPVVGG